MPVSRKYCLKTPKRKMGFSQIATCKALGLLKRTSKKYNGKYIISPKYRKTKKDGLNKSLYANNKKNKKPRVRSGYGNEKIARQTLRNIRSQDKQYQMQIVNTMYNRAKYHANQTEDMRKAMKVFKSWLKKKKSL